MSKICPKCNKEFESGKFCLECGTALVDKNVAANVCPKCGYVNPEGSNFCQECGTKLFVSEKKANRSSVDDFDEDEENFNFLYEMVHVEGGTLELNDEKIKISPFYVCRYPVSIHEWQEIMGYTDDPTGFDYGDSFVVDEEDMDDIDENLKDFRPDALSVILQMEFEKERPVYGASWYEVMKFIDLLNAKYPGYDFRLPTKYEWIYAAKGGRRSKPYKYAGSDNIDDVAWYNKNSNQNDGSMCFTGPAVHRFGQKKPNSLGLHDMSGNVHEWTSTSCSGFLGIENEDGKWAKAMGGCCGSKKLWCTVLDEYSTKKTNNDETDAIGFRLVCEHIIK